MRTFIIMLITRLEVEADTISRGMQEGTILREIQEAGTISPETQEIRDSIFLATRNISLSFSVL